MLQVTKNRQKIQTKSKGTKKRILPQSPLVRSLVLLLLVAILIGGGMKVYAETYPGGADNGQTSRLKSLATDITNLGYGSDSNAPDWGALWNRIATSAKWTPSGNATANDVRSGKTFYKDSRTQQTGTYPAPTSCSTMVWSDENASANQTDNCTSDLTWTVPSPTVTGDEKKDPRTGLIWSNYLKNNAGTVEFATSGGTVFSWDASAAANVAVGGKTASQLCSERGNGWRLPSQKEAMQAYIDGSKFNLTNPALIYWTSTKYSATGAWYVYLQFGEAARYTMAGAFNVRCVR